MENHMVLGDPYPASWDEPNYTKEEKIKLTEDYLSTYFNPSVIMEIVVNEWDYAELYGLMMRNSLRLDFNRSALTYLSRKIYKLYGFYPDEDQIAEFLDA